MHALTTKLSGQNDAATQPAWRMRAVAVVVTLVANVINLSVGRVVNGEFPMATVDDEDQTIGFAQVIVVTALAGLAVWGLLALLERTTSRARAIWTALAVLVFALSLLGPLGSGVNTSSQVVLACLHGGAAAPIIPLLLRSAATRG